VRLGRELEIVRDYLEIQRLRFGERLDVSVEVDASACDINVPPLVLQPLVENAILHGIGDRPRGRVAVRVSREADRVLLSVRDDGPGPGASRHEGTGTSVANLRDRLSQLYGERAGFSLFALAGGGCDARVFVPASA
jgi:two-component system sensor histidine kinase AlgZ